MKRVAIVTGAARGIGAATVDALVNDGYQVVAVDRCRDIAEVPYAMATPAELTCNSPWRPLHDTSVASTR